MSTRVVRKKRSAVKIDFDTNYVVTVNRFNKNILAQVLEPKTKKTIFTINSNSIKKGSKTDKSIEIGEKVAEFLNSKKVDKIIFNRNGFMFRGRVKAIAEGIKKGNINI